MPHYLSVWYPGVLAIVVVQYDAVLFCECNSWRYANAIVYCNDLTYSYLIMTPNLKYPVMCWNFKRQKLFEMLDPNKVDSAF